MKKWMDEIKLVGLSNWLWFVFLLKRNEFSKSLDVSNYPYTKDGGVQCARDRQRAHLIDAALSGDKTVTIEQINRAKTLRYC